MRTLKLYGGIILILIAVIVLAVSFFTGALTSAGTANIILAHRLGCVSDYPHNLVVSLPINWAKNL